MYKYRSQFGLWAPKHQEQIICTAVYLCPNSEEETGLVQNGVWTVHDVAYDVVYNDNVRYCEEEGCRIQKESAEMC